MSVTIEPGRLIVESDYVNLARELLDGSPLKLTRLELQNPAPRELVMVIEGVHVVHELAAVELLREFWLYDWMSVAVRIDFRAAKA